MYFHDCGHSGIQISDIKYQKLLLVHQFKWHPLFLEGALKTFKKFMLYFIPIKRAVLYDTSKEQALPSFKNLVPSLVPRRYEEEL